MPAPRLLAVLVAALLIVGLPALAGSPARADEVAPPVATAEPAPIAVPAPTDVPAAVPAVFALGDRVIRLGDTGPDVQALQKLLKVKQTATFDTRTRKAVKKAQRSAGVKATGVVTARTLKAVKKVAKARARAAKSSSRGLPRAGAPAASKRFAAAYISRTYGWGSGQMSCLSSLWTRESGWRYWASNPNGRYHGIPQTSSAVWRRAGYSTSQYMHSPAIQIRVGAKYIKGRYGSPCQAWSFWRSHHWY